MLQQKSQLDLYLLRDRQEIQALMSQGDGLVLVVDREGTIQYASPSARTLLTAFPEEVLGQHMFAFLHRTDMYPVKLALEHLVSSQEAPAALLIRLFINRERWQWFKATAMAVHHCDDTPYIAVSLQSLRSFLPVAVANANYAA